MTSARMCVVAALAAASSWCFALDAIAQQGERAASSGGCGKPHPAGTTVYTLRSGNLDREFLLVVPQHYDGTTPLPAVLALHGSGSGPQEQLALSGLAAAAEERGFLVLAPQAATAWPTGGFTWNVPPDPAQPDDVAFVAALIDEAAEHVCLDASRVYASGFSGGARLASELGCALADRIAAIGAVGGLRHPSSCSPPRAVPIVAFHGTADPINPYAGGGPVYWGESVDEVLRGWASQYGAESPVQAALSITVTRIVYAGSGEEDLVFYRLEGVGHVWPGTSLDLPVERLGPMSDEIDATRIMLDFFERHSLP
jgi:polyhydroxybutyrate depolymerase